MTTSPRSSPARPAPPAARRSPGLAFNPPGGTLPAAYNGALFFADYSRNCIWVQRRDGGTLPAGTPRTFRAGAAGPVDLEMGPGNDLFYPELNGGRIRRIHYTAGNQAPRAVASASVTSGDTPLDVSFDGNGSSDPDPGSSLTYAWDLDGDGEYDDGSGPQASFTYTEAGSYPASLRVTDGQGATATDTVAITAGNTPPTATIASPTAGFTWEANAPIDFEGGAVDPQDGELPASALSWSVVLSPLPRQLPYPHGSGLPRRIPGLVRGARPRVPVVPRAAPHGHRQRRAHRHALGPPRPQDRRA